MLLTAAGPRLQDLDPGLDPERVRPGVLALVIVLALCVLTFLLWRSMNKQLKKIRFDDRDGSVGADPARRDGDHLAATRNGDRPDRGPDPSGGDPPDDVPPSP